MEQVARHPSEVIRFTAVRLDPAEFRVGAVDVREAVIRQALDEAKAEGLAWTPLLDVLSTEGVWPILSDYAEDLYDDTDLPDPDEWLSERLAVWVRQASSEETQALFAFEAEPLWRVIALHGRDLSAEQVDRLLEKGSQRTARALAANEAAMEKHDAAVIRHMYEFGRSSGRAAKEAVGFVRRMAWEGRLPQDVLERIFGNARQYGWKTLWKGSQQIREPLSDGTIEIALEDARPAGDDLKALADAGEDGTRAWASVIGTRTSRSGSMCWSTRIRRRPKVSGSSASSRSGTTFRTG